MQNQHSQNQKIINQISKETGYSPAVVKKIIQQFFIGLRKIMYRNGEINLYGLFKIKLKPYYKRKVIENPDINLRKRSHLNKKVKR